MTPIRDACASLDLWILSILAGLAAGIEYWLIFAY